MSENVTEKWGAPIHRRDVTILVSGPDAFVETVDTIARRKLHLICQVDVSWTWSDPNAEDAPGDPFVRLATAYPDGVTPNGGKLFLDQLFRTPEWLSSIITRSMPRL